MIKVKIHLEEKEEKKHNAPHEENKDDFINDKSNLKTSRKILKLQRMLRIILTCHVYLKRNETKNEKEKNR